MKRFFFFLLLFATIALSAQVQFTRPKLVVGIVVDQMRHDYIYRYWDRYGKGGFKRLVSEGYFFRNTHYNYVPTYTGPGHASIYTGATPAAHGIISNEWYSKDTGKDVYCTEDKDAKPVGSESKAGMMSPKNMLTTTMGDELKLATGGRSKVFGISLKDRSSILPAGHSANGAFWFDGSSGKFISSSHYMKELPAWLNDFNSRQLAKSYLEQGWNTLYALASYTASIADDNAYEGAPNKKERPVFPYDYKAQLDKNTYDIIRATPYGNTITKDLALACLNGEQLGKGAETDMLCISFSSTDYVAHAHGPRSVEIEDMYLRLDKDLEDLLKALDAQVGKGNYVLFLTADHGGCDVPKYLQDLKIPAGYFDEKSMEKALKGFCKEQFGDTLLLSLSNQQVFLNESKMAAMKLDRVEVEQQLANYLLSIKGVSEAYPSSALRYENYTDNNFKYLVQKGYNHVRSGNVAFTLNPAWMEAMKTGTTHGASYSYDTHVPLIFFGTGIPKGSSARKINIVDIAPTISTLLHISFPNGTLGLPLQEIIH